MMEFGFEKGEKWQYDPYNIISNKKVEFSYVAYIYESRPKIENI